MSSVSDAEVIPSSEDLQMTDADPVPDTHDEDDVPISNTLKARQLKKHAEEEMERMIDRINCVSDGDNDSDTHDPQLEDSVVEVPKQESTIPPIESETAALADQGGLEEPAPMPAHNTDLGESSPKESNSKKMPPKGKAVRVKVTSDPKINKRSSATGKQTKKVPIDKTKGGRPRQPSQRQKGSASGKSHIKSSVKSPNGEKEDGQPTPKATLKPSVSSGTNSKLDGSSTTARPKPASVTSGAKSSKSVRLKKVIDKQSRNLGKTIVSKGSPAKFPLKASKGKDLPEGKVKGTGKGKRGSATKKEDQRKRAKKQSEVDEDVAEEVGDEDVVSIGEDEGDQEGTQDNDSYVLHTPLKGSILENLACSSRDTNTRALLDHAVQQLGKFRVVDCPEGIDVPLRAFIVGKDTRRGWTLLHAIASGVALINEDWLCASISEGNWADIDAYRSDRFGQSPRGIDATAGTNSILNGMRVKVECPNDATQVRKLIKVCGGRVAETRMDMVINDGRPAVQGAINVTKKWLADSIEAGVALDLDAYDISPRS